MGICQNNVNALANVVNSAQRRLLYAREGGEEGWYGTWAEIVFNVSRAEPYITLPREVARLEAINVCNTPVMIQNQFFEYLTFGNGRMPKDWQQHQGEVRQMYSRNNAVTFTEMSNTPQFISAYATDELDVGKRILVQGLDADSNTIYSLDGAGQVTGSFLSLAFPTPVTTAMTLSQLAGLQKDITFGPVRIYQHDPTTGDEVLLLTMQPGEQTAQYRRYYLHNLPCNCCQSPNDPSLVQVTALAKLEPLPVRVDTDWLLIQNLEAIIEECASIRYSEMDTMQAKQMAAERHRQAIGLLNGELNHYIGKESIAIGFSPFGSAKLGRQRIGTLI